MAWEDLPTTLDNRAGSTDPRVTLAIRKESSSTGLGIIASLNKALLHKLDWLPRMRVKPQIDRERGLCRLTKAQKGAAARGNESGGMTVRLIIPDLSLAAHPAEVIEHEITDDGLVLTLPAWAKPAQDGAAFMLRGTASGAVRVVPPPAQAPATPPVAAALPAAEEQQATPPEPRAEGDATPAEAPPAELPLWSADRKALLKQLWPQVGLVSLKGIIQQLNDMPGPRLANDGQLYAEAARQALPKSRMAAADAWSAQQQKPATQAKTATVPAVAAPPPARASVHGSTKSPLITVADEDARIRAEVADCMAAGMGARAIDDELRVGLDTVLRHKAAIEAEQRAAKAAQSAGAPA